MTRTTLVAIALLTTLPAYAAPAKRLPGVELDVQSSDPIRAGKAGLYRRSSDGKVVLRDASNTTTALDSLGSVTVDAPLAGDGSTGSHLTCTPCVVTGTSYSNPSWITALAASKLSGTLTLSSSFAATVGSWTSGISSQTSTTVNFHRYTPNDASTTPWYQWAGSFANGINRRNQVMRFGWNVNAGGGRENAGALNGALSEEWEQYYEAPTKVMERHMAYIDPADNLTRYLSFMGALESPYPTSLFLRASSVNLASGNDSNDQPGLILGAATSTLSAPSSYPRLTLDDTGGGYVTLANGVLADPDKAHVQLNYLGGVDILSKQIFVLRNATNTGLYMDPSTIQVVDPSATPLHRMIVNNDGISFFTGSVNSFGFLMYGSGNYSAKPLRPHQDKNIAYGLGVSGGRFPWLGASLGSVAWLAQSCTADDEGIGTTVNYGTGQPSCYEICMKSGSDTFSRVQVKCAAP
jgi:hypothetical protein